MTHTVRLRPRSAADDGFVHRLRVEHATTTMMGLPPSLVESLAEAQAHAFEASIDSYDSVSDWIVEAGGDSVGRLVCSEPSDEQLLVDLLVSPSFRGLGIGASVLQMAMESADARGVPTRLSVQRTNPAARLYARLGFVVTGSDELNCFMQRTPQPQQQHV